MTGGGVRGRLQVESLYVDKKIVILDAYRRNTIGIRKRYLSRVCELTNTSPL